MKGWMSSGSEMRGRRMEGDDETENVGGLDDFEEDEEFEDADLDEEEGEEEALDDEKKRGTTTSTRTLMTTANLAAAGAVVRRGTGRSRLRGWTA